MIKIKGMTWNHKRGIKPLEAAAKEFQRTHPDLQITWDARSLEDFEDYPVELLAERYDLLMIDHPFVGTGVLKGVIEPLNDWFSPEFLLDQKKNSVGPSYESYTWEGQQWALAVDAAAQVSAYRPDLLAQQGATVPKSWEEVIHLAKELRTNQYIGIPLVYTHAYCSFISLCANLGSASFLQPEEGFNQGVGAEALELLKRVKELAHPLSVEMNPIHMLDMMSSTDEVTYIPLIFGYSNYARATKEKKTIHFGNIPSVNSTPNGSILGGVGLALSTQSSVKQHAVAFMEYVASATCQTELFVAAEGQPGYRQAWQGKLGNELTNQFFSDTLATLDLAYVRPRYAGYSEFQKQAGQIIHAFLTTSSQTEESTLLQINEAYKQSLALSTKK